MDSSWTVMDSFDVAILGGGPLGLFAAHLLSSHGITVIVLGMRDEDQPPRAVHFNSDILRLMRSASNKLSRRMLEHVQLLPEVPCGDASLSASTLETEGGKCRKGKVCARLPPPATGCDLRTRCGYVTRSVSGACPQLLHDYIRIFEDEFMTHFTPTHTFHQPTFENLMRELLDNEYEPDETLVSPTLVRM
jgi:hypothetical protein